MEKDKSEPMYKVVAISLSNLEEMYIFAICCDGIVATTLCKQLLSVYGSGPSYTISVLPVLDLEETLNKSTNNPKEPPKNAIGFL